MIESCSKENLCIHNDNVESLNDDIGDQLIILMTNAMHCNDGSHDDNDDDDDDVNDNNDDYDVDDKITQESVWQEGVKRLAKTQLERLDSTQCLCFRIRLPANQKHLTLAH